MIERSDYYVYVIFRPNGEPCYVGKGRGDRCERHARKSSNSRLAKIYERANGVLPIWKAQEGLTNAEAIATERALISALGRANKKSGPLVNFTDGGEGTEGYKMSPESIERRSAKRRGQKQSPEAVAQRVAKTRGQKRSGESLENLRRAQAMNAEGRKGKPQPATPAMLTAAEKRRGQPLTAEARKKISEANSGKKRTPEMSARQSERQKGYVASPEARAKISAAGRGLKRSPETCAKISAYQRGKTVSEESRAKMRASAALRCAREKAERAGCI